MTLTEKLTIETMNKWYKLTPMQRLEIMNEVKKVKQYKKCAYYQRACIQYMIEKKI